MSDDGKPILIVCCFVDDIIHGGLDTENTRFATALKAKFLVQTHHKLTYYTGIEFEHDPDRNTLKAHQRKYILDLLARFNLQNIHPSATPADPNVSLIPSTTAPSTSELEEIKDLEAKLPYKTIVGALLHLARCTRPDLSFLSSELSKYLKGPRVIHYKTVKRILRYLKHSIDIGLVYPIGTDGSIHLDGFVDASWGNSTNRRSTTGYVFRINGTAVSWRSKQQGIVAISSTEAEYIALSEGSRECMYLRNLLFELGFPPQGPTIIYEDNTGCIFIANGKGEHDRRKHIDIKAHFIQDCIQQGFIHLEHIDSSHQAADLLTKVSTQPKMSSFIKKFTRIP